MEKLKMHTPNLTQDNMQRIRVLFPHCVTESRDEAGEVKLAIDFDALKQELSDSIVEGPQERYHLNWPGKREALLTANAPIAKTLRPIREESIDFDTTKNLFIEGDNLDALKLLQETYLGKVKMIYIDPPYNTGNDFIYEDDFAEDTDEFMLRSNQKDQQGNRLVANTEANGKFHSDWLSMIYPRLKLARNLLRDDGIVYISVDDNEISSLKAICNEVFGQDNYIAEVVWEKMYTTKNDAALMSNCHEYILVYAKNIETKPVHLLPRTSEMDARYTNPDNDPRGNWKAIPLYAKGERRNGRYPVISPLTKKEHFPEPDSHWLYSEADTNALIKDNRIYFGKDGNAQPNIKRFLTEVQQGTKSKTIWKHTEVGSNDSAKRELKELYSKEKLPFDFPKPTSLIKRMLFLSTEKGSVILDFFAGSSTTAHAVMQQNAEDGGNRTFIMVQLPEACDEKSEAFKAGYATIAEISKERIRRAGAKIKSENALAAPNLDIGFRVLKIDTSNMAEVYYTPDSVRQDDLLAAVDNIKPDRSSEDLLFQVLLDSGVDLTLPIETKTIQGKTVFFVDNNVLVACFDKGITEELIKELAAFKPLRAIFRDNGFANDAIKINAEQIFKQMSPSTDVKSI